MGNSAISEMVLSPLEVREILKLSNEEIIKLCKQASIAPQRNQKGLTYFSYDEVKRLKELRENSRATLVNSKNFQILSNIRNTFLQMENNISQNVMNSMNRKFEKIEEFFNEFSQSKNENETLKLKIAQISKENCYLKDQLEEFKPIGLGIYIKNKNRDYSI